MMKKSGFSQENPPVHRYKDVLMCIVAAVFAVQALATLAMILWA